MERVKKFSMQTIAIVVLSVLLAISVTVGGTMAWFSSYTTATDQVTIGSGIYAQITSGLEGAYYNESSPVAMVVKGTNLVPNAPIEAHIGASCKSSTTSVMYRMYVDITVSNTGLTDQQRATLKTEFDAQMKITAAKNGWYLATSTNYYYYTGVNATYTNVSEVPEFNVLNEDRAVTTSMLRSVNNNAGNGSITKFVDGTNDLRLPEGWDNTVENSSVIFNFRLEAVQANFVDSTAIDETGLITSATGDGLNADLLVNAADAVTAFNQAFNSSTGVTIHASSVTSATATVGD